MPSCAVASLFARSCVFIVDTGNATAVSHSISTTRYHLQQELPTNAALVNDAESPNAHRDKEVKDYSVVR
jgi:hypothetical protein